MTYLSQFMKKQRMSLSYCYLKDTTSHDVMLSFKSDLSLNGFTDSYFTGCPTTRHSITGYFVMMVPTVARSSAQAQYRALINPTYELQ